MYRVEKKKAEKKIVVTRTTRSIVEGRKKNNKRKKQTTKRKATDKKHARRSMHAWKIHGGARVSCSKRTTTGGNVLVKGRGGPRRRSSAQGMKQGKKERGDVAEHVG